MRRKEKKIKRVENDLVVDFKYMTGHMAVTIQIRTTEVLLGVAHCSVVSYEYLTRFGSQPATLLSVLQYVPKTFKVFYRSDETKTRAGTCLNTCESETDATSCDLD